MNSFKTKKAVAVFCVFVVVVVPISIVNLLPEMKVTPIPGVSVSETVFADLVSEFPDPVMFPNGETVESNYSFYMRPVPTNAGIVNENEVYAAAAEFLDREPWLQDVSYSVHDEPTFDGRWYTGFRGEIINGDIDVSPLSAKVLRYRVFWDGEPPFAQHLDCSDIIDKGEIEQFAIDFLTRHNYTLSQYARYSGPTIEDRIVGPDYLVYKLTFHNVVDGAIVSEGLFHNPEAGSLRLYLDPQIGTVVGFFYFWTHVSSLPVHRTMTVDRAEAVAIQHMSDRFDTSSLSLKQATLVFERLGSLHDNNYFLAWVLFRDSPGWTIHVDAINGEVLDEMIQLLP
ncbi:MAG: hypothetical protein ACW99U_01585 [Candidatus Thorarchaeota archaeon]